MKANITVSKKRHGAAEIKSPAELVTILQKNGDSLYLFPGAPRELPQNFDAAGRSSGFVTLENHKDIVEYSLCDQVISLSLGMTLAEVAEITAKNKQFLPLSAPPETTLFDLLNGGDGGLYEHAFGGPRDLIMGVKAILSDGKTINTGGKVVKNVTGYDTTKILVGGRMYFAVPVAAHFRLYARPEWMNAMELSARSVLELLDQAAVFMQSEIPITALAICGSKDSGASLFLQLCGYKVVVDELIKPLKELTAKTIAVEETSQEFGAGDSQLSKYCLTNKHSIELSASVQEMRQVLSMLNDHLSGTTEIKVRPGTGRMTICCKDAQEMSLCLEHLRGCLESAELSIVAAYADDTFERKIERLGVIHDGSSNQAIVRSLKLQFDQKRILNPLVSW